mgnify:CR=1 FL=1
MPLFTYQARDSTGQLVVGTVGDEVGYLRVTQILPERVTLSDGVESYTLTLEVSDEAK